MDINIFMQDATRDFVAKLDANDLVSVVVEFNSTELADFQKAVRDLNTSAIGAVFFRALGRQYESSITELAQREADAIAEAMRDDFEDLKHEGRMAA